MHCSQVILYRSDDDELFVADIPQLSGRMPYRDIHEEALSEAQAAIGCLLEDAQKIGKPIPRRAGELVMPSPSWLESTTTRQQAPRDPNKRRLSTH